MARTYRYWPGSAEGAGEESRASLHRSRKYNLEARISKHERREEDSDVDFEASRRSTRVQSKSTIRSALFLAKH